MGNDDEEDIALPAPSTCKPKVAVKQDATAVIPEHVPADGDTSTMRTRTAKALEKSLHTHRYWNTDSTLEFPRALP
jgi:hypothetical protein